MISVDWFYSSVLSDEEDAPDRQFDGMCFAFPTPFKAGDILIDRTFGARSGKTGPLVLSSINTWDSETLLKNGFSPKDPWVKSADKVLEKMLQSADISDIYCHGYYPDADCAGLPVLCEDAWYTYLGLEYYRAPLRGMDRVFKAVSSAMVYGPEYGGSSIDTALLCNAYQLILNKEMCKSSAVPRRVLSGRIKGEGGIEMMEKGDL